MAQDVLKAAISLLKADAAVAALVSARVFGEELPTSEASSMPRKAVVVRRGAGTAGLGGYLEVERAPLDVFCWGETPLESEKVRQAVHEALKQARRQVRDGVLLHGFEPNGGPAALRDPDTQWPYTLSTWSFLASEAAAT